MEEASLRVVGRGQTAARCAHSLLGPVAAVAWALSLSAATAQAGPVWGASQQLIQPDGARVPVRIWGDEFYHVVESPDGYTLVRDPLTGVICYAGLSEDGTKLVSTGLRFEPGGAAPPGIAPHLRIKPQAAAVEILAARREHDLQLEKDRPPLAGGVVTALPTTGQVRGICLIVDFSDEPAVIPPEEIDRFCNLPGYSGFGNNGSVRDYFRDVSQDLLTYTNDVPAAYHRASRPKTYYTNPSVPYGTRAVELVTEAIEALDAAGLDFSLYDSNGDGAVDAVNCLYAGPPNSAWSKGLWPHAGSLSLQKDGVWIYRYQISDTGGGLKLATFCHENGHMLCGWPDLYDYGFDSWGAGRYCIMSYPTSDQNPQEPCAYLKLKAGWAAITDLSGPTIRFTVPNASTNVCFRYRRPGRSNEYYLIENRQKTGRDAQLPDAGLAIWHIDTFGSNNWQHRTLDYHYEATLVQADGRWDLETNVNSGDSTDLYAAPTHTACTPLTSPDTHWWDGVASGLYIRNIGPSGETMVFDFGPPTDCNGNGVPDDADIGSGTSADCNSNGRPDECDIAGAFSPDCDGNGVPDECQSADSDGDGRIDPCDNCPATWNPGQEDLDGDGVGDACDGDDDDDGVGDLQDNCPRTPNPGQTDGDGDAVGDACDACPDTVPGAPVGPDGCPPGFVCDRDRDGDIDQVDYGRLQNCITGSYYPQYDPACVWARLDGDGDVDSADVAIFLRCLGGPNVPLNPTCLGGGG